MSRRFTEPKLLLATNNLDKVKEIVALFAPFGVEIVSATDLNIEEPEETGKTFAENAILKAKYYGQITGLPALSDDSGLCVEALEDYPGILSARIAGENKDFTQAFKLIETRLARQRLTSSEAFFVCSLAIAWPDGHVETFEGKVSGVIAFPASEVQGFGYDPIFTPKGYKQNFAEMDPALKNKISHRASAFKQLLEMCF